MKSREVESTLQPDQIAKKIRSCLLAQREKLEEYMVILDKEQEDLLVKNPDKLIAHIEIEKNILSELEALKKIVNPLETMYFNSPYKKDMSLVDMRQHITLLSDQINEKANKNKEKLETIIVKVKADLKNISKTGITKTAYKAPESTLVDVCG